MGLLQCRVLHHPRLPQHTLVSHRVVLLHDVVGDGEEQRALHLLDLREVFEHRQCHQLQLSDVGILRALARLVVHDTSLIAVDNQQVHDAAEPHVLIEEATRLEISGEAHLEFAVLLPRHSRKPLHSGLHERELRRHGLAVADELLTRLVKVSAVSGRLGLLERELLEDVHVVVLLRTRLKRLHPTKGPSTGFTHLRSTAAASRSISAVRWLTSSPSSRNSAATISSARTG